MASSLSSSIRREPCGLLALPAELKVHVAKMGLSYFDLKRLGATCKTFWELVLLPTFDEDLFRGLPKNDLSRGTKVTLHPLLQAVRTFVITRSEAAIAVSKTGQSESILIHLEASNENACHPPAREIQISGELVRFGRHTGGGMTAEEGSALTVEHVAELCADMWNDEWYYERDRCEYLGHDYCMCGRCNSNNPDRYRSFKSYYLMVFEKYGFEGLHWTEWAEPQVYVDGIVHLTSTPDATVDESEESDQSNDEADSEEEEREPDYEEDEDEDEEEEEEEEEEEGNEDDEGKEEGEATE